MKAAAGAIVIALAVLAGVTKVAAQATPPQLVVNRALPQQTWASAADAPRFADVGVERRLSVWDSRDGTLLRTVPLHPAVDVPCGRSSQPQIAMSNDGTLTAFGDSGGLGLVPTSGRVRRLPTTLAGSVTPVAFTPDNTQLAVSVAPAPDPQSCQPQPDSLGLVSTVNGRATLLADAQTTAAFSPDGRVIATLARARDRLLLYDTHGGPVRSFADGGGVYGPLVFSPDGTLIASAGDDPSIPPRGNGIYDPSSTDHDLVVKLWNVRSGRLVMRLPWRATYARVPLDERIHGAFAFADPQTIAIDTGTQTNLYDTRSGSVLAVLTPQAKTSFTYRANGRLGFVHESPTDVTFTHVTGTTEKTDAVIPFAAAVSTVTIDGPGQTLAVADSPMTDAGRVRNGVYALDLRALRWTSLGLANDAPQPIQSDSLRFLPDGRLALMSPSALLYVDVRTGQIVRHPNPGAADVVNESRTFSVSGDGQTVFSGQPTGLLDPSGADSPGAVPEVVPLRAYDVATGRLRYTVSGIMGTPAACSTTNTRCAALQRTTADNLGHQHDPVTVAIIDATSGEVAGSVHFHSWVHIVGFFDADRHLALGELLETNVDRDFIDIVNPRNATVERRFETTGKSLTFAPAAPLYALTDAAGTTIYHLNGARLTVIPQSVTGDSDGTTFFPDGSKLAFHHPDGTIGVCAVTSGRLLVTLTFFKHGADFDWLAYTPAGYFAGSPFALTTIRWRAGERTFADAALSARFYRPDVIEDALR